MRYDIITSQADLAPFLPNAVATVDGELTMFERMEEDIAQAHAWLYRFIINREVATLYLATQEGTRLMELLRPVVAYTALAAGLPKLDLVLTPNGFAVVSNQNLAPASPTRVQRLVEQLLASRDQAADLLLCYLPELSPVVGNSGESTTPWRSSTQGVYFCSSLFQHPSAVKELATSCNLQHYVAYRRHLDESQRHLARVAFSPEAVAEMVQAVTSHREGVYGGILREVCSIIEADALSTAPVSKQRIADCVEDIRAHRTLGALWSNSATAQLYSPPVFHNKRHSGGYFF